MYTHLASKGHIFIQEFVLRRRLYHHESGLAKVVDCSKDVDSVSRFGFVQQIPEGDESAGATDAGAAVNEDRRGGGRGGSRGRGGDALFRFFLDELYKRRHFRG